jgi:hypothetical protein
MLWKELGYAIVFVVLLAAMYVGAYYAMVQREEIDVLLRYRPPSIRAHVAYRFGGEAAHSMFSPMHEIDRYIRQDWWKDESELWYLRTREDMTP